MVQDERDRVRSVMKALVGPGIEQQKCFWWRHFHHFLDEYQSFFM